jgi:hypothetical protein
MMPRMRTLLVSVLGAALIGQALAAETEFGPFDMQVAPAAFEERCVKLAAGESIRYRFKADRPVDFNIHYHRGNEVFYPVKKAAVAERVGRFRAKSADVYCLMWENKGKSAALVNGVLENTDKSRETRPIRN